LSLRISCISFQTLRLGQTFAMRTAFLATLIWLAAFIALKWTTSKFAFVAWLCWICWIRWISSVTLTCLILRANYCRNSSCRTIFNTRSPTAVSSIPIALCFIVFAVTCSISNPNFDAGIILVFYFLIYHYFLVRFTIIIAVVNNLRLRKCFIRENFSAWSPSVSKSLADSDVERK